MNFDSLFRYTMCNIHSLNIGKTLCSLRNVFHVYREIYAFELIKFLSTGEYKYISPPSTIIEHIEIHFCV